MDPQSYANLDKYTEAYYDIRSRKGMTHIHARKRMREANDFGPMMVKMGDADAFVSGLTYEYPEVIRPALQIHHTAGGAGRAAGVYIMIIGTRPISSPMPPSTLTPAPKTWPKSPRLAADFARKMEVEPRVAFLSFSNFGSTPHPLSEKVSQAVALVKQRRPDW